METDLIKDKIRKLLALAERGGTEAEADSAMAKVQELLTKHNLDIDAVRGKEEVTLVQEHHDHPWNQTWIRRVYQGVSRLYFCKFYYTPYGTTKQVCTLIGEPVNIQTAKYVTDFVIAMGNRLAKDYARQVHEFTSDVGEAISATNNFKKGFADRIYSRCLELIREASTKPTAAGESTALVVADFYKNNQLTLDKAAKEQFGLSFTSNRTAGPTNHSHAASGAFAAENVNLRSGGLTHKGQPTFRLGSN